MGARQIVFKQLSPACVEHQWGYEHGHASKEEGEGDDQLRSHESLTGGGGKVFELFSEIISQCSVYYLSCVIFWPNTEFPVFTPI